MEKNYSSSKKILYDIKKAILEEEVLELRCELNKIHDEKYGNKNN